MTETRSRADRIRTRVLILLRWSLIDRIGRPAVEHDSSFSLSLSLLPFRRPPLPDLSAPARPLARLIQDFREAARSGVTGMAAFNVAS